MRVRSMFLIVIGGEQGWARLGGRVWGRYCNQIVTRGKGIYINVFFNLLGRYRRAGQAG
jgi:hypothetical protein